MGQIAQLTQRPELQQKLTRTEKPDVDLEDLFTWDSWTGTRLGLFLSSPSPLSPSLLLMDRHSLLLLFSFFSSQLIHNGLAKSEVMDRYSRLFPSYCA
jgi:hypothetical protein